MAKTSATAVTNALKKSYKAAKKSVKSLVPVKDQRISEVTRFESGLKGTGQTVVTGITSRQAVKIANAPYRAKISRNRMIGASAASAASTGMGETIAKTSAALKDVGATKPTVLPDGTRTDPAEDNKKTDDQGWAQQIGGL